MAGAGEFQLDWDVERLRRNWLVNLSNSFLIARVSQTPSDLLTRLGFGTVLEVAAADCEHACQLSARGFDCVALEPSPVMLEKARQRLASTNTRVRLVRGIVEDLPFASGIFDYVLCNSAIDHFADPEQGMREMTRVLKPTGRLLIGAVNYGGFSARVSRPFYRIGRSIGVLDRDVRFWWDTPVPIEHSFELTYGALRQLCEPMLEFESCNGISLGWGLPGWTALTALLAERSKERALTLLQWADRLAYHWPRGADYIMAVCRPRRDARPARPAAAPIDDCRVHATDVVYPRMVRGEKDYWTWHFGSGAAFKEDNPLLNRAYSGDPEKTWFDDAIARGTFRHAAVLGCDEYGYEREWLRRGASELLDIYELNPAVIAKVRRSIDERDSLRARFVEADLNFVRLPVAQYDAIWSSGCLHHITNLEHLFGEVERALRPGGLFIVHDYVGERRLRLDPRRLDRINAVLAEIPARYRRVDQLEQPDPERLSPFCGVRSDEIVEQATTRFDVVHLVITASLFPLHLAVDLEALQREEPKCFEWLSRAEREAQADPQLRPCLVYAVLRPKGAA